MRDPYVHVPHPKKPGGTVLKPVFDGFYINIDEQCCGAITVMIVFDGSRVWTIYGKMFK